MMHRILNNRYNFSKWRNIESANCTFCSAGTKDYTIDAMIECQQSLNTIKIIMSAIDPQKKLENFIN